jgi:hypothetical protein
MPTNLPIKKNLDGAEKSRIFFDEYGRSGLELSAADLDRVIAFFTARGFGEDAAFSTSITLLQRAKVDAVPVAILLDTMAGFTQVQLSGIVAEILNNDRKNTSVLGFRVASAKADQIKRNVFP